MYHSISDSPEPGVAPYYRTNTSPAEFRRQMQFLADNGYHTISLAQAIQWLRSEAEGVEHAPEITDASCTGPIVLTFDDGFRDFYTHAFPILQEFNFTASVFLPTAFIKNAPLPKSSSPLRGEGRGEVNQNLSKVSSRPSTPVHFQNRQFLSWSEVSELRRAGMTFGSHTVTHPKLVDLNWPVIQSEISVSKSEIEQRLGESITGFCYPFAFPQANHAFAVRFTKLLAETGYTSCLTTQVGRVECGDNPFTLKRLPMNDCDDSDLLKAKLDGAYDWMGIPQACIKRCKSWLAHKHFSAD